MLSVCGRPGEGQGQRGIEIRGGRGIRGQRKDVCGVSGACGRMGGGGGWRVAPELCTEKH